MKVVRIEKSAALNESAVSFVNPSPMEGFGNFYVLGSAPKDETHIPGSEDIMKTLVYAKVYTVGGFEIGSMYLKAEKVKTQDSNGDAVVVEMEATLINAQGTTKGIRRFLTRNPLASGAKQLILCGEDGNDQYVSTVSNCMREIAYNFNGEPRYLTCDFAVYADVEYVKIKGKIVTEREWPSWIRKYLSCVTREYKEWRSMISDIDSRKPSHRYTYFLNELVTDAVSGEDVAVSGQGTISDGTKDTNFEWDGNIINRGGHADIEISAKILRRKISATASYAVPTTLSELSSSVGDAIYRSMFGKDRESADDPIVEVYINKLNGKDMTAIMTDMIVNDINR